MSPSLQVCLVLFLAQAPQGEVIAGLIEQLDSRSFPEREAAAKKLEDIGEPALPALEVMLKTGKTLEVRRRAERVIEAIEKRYIRPRALRAVERFTNQPGPGVEECIPDLVWLLRDNELWGQAAFILECWAENKPHTVVPLLVLQAEQGPPSARPRAIETLEYIGPKAKAMVPTLNRLLRDRDPWVRSRAARALGNIGDKAATPALLAMLTTDGNYDVRRRAATALGELGPEPTVVPALIQAIKDHQKLLNTLELTETVRNAFGAVSIGGTGMEARSLDVRAGDALVSLGPPALPAVSELLKEKDAGQRAEAARILYGLAEKTPRAIAPLVEALDDKDRWMQHQVAEYIGALGGRAKMALPKLAQLLQDPDEYMRTEFAGAMLAIDANQVAPLGVLQEALHSEHPDTRARAADLLVRAGSRAKGSVASLTALLKDKQSFVRDSAGKALKAIDPEAAAKAGIK